MDNQNALGEEEYKIVIDNDTGSSESLENIAKQLVITSDGEQAADSTRHLIESLSKLLCTMPTGDEAATVHDPSQGGHTGSSISPSANHDASFGNHQTVNIEVHKEVTAKKDALKEELASVTSDFKAYKEKHLWLVNQVHIMCQRLSHFDYSCKSSLFYISLK